MNLSEWMFRVELEKYNTQEETRVKLMKIKDQLVIELQERLLSNHEDILDVRGGRSFRYKALNRYTECAELLIQIEDMGTNELKGLCIGDSDELMDILNSSKHIV